MYNLYILLNFEVLYIYEFNYYLCNNRVMFNLLHYNYFP